MTYEPTVTVQGRCYDCGTYNATGWHDFTLKSGRRVPLCIPCLVKRVELPMADSSRSKAKPRGVSPMTTVSERANCPAGGTAIDGLEVLDESNAERIKVKCPSCGRRVGSYYSKRKDAEVVETHWLPREKGESSATSAQQGDSAEQSTETSGANVELSSPHSNGAARELVTPRGVRYPLNEAGTHVIVDATERELSAVDDTPGVYIFRHPKGRDVAGRVEPYVAKS